MRAGPLASLIALLIATVVALAFSPAVNACTVLSSYRVPTTLQMVGRADAIVLARVEDGGPSKIPGAEKDGFRAAKLIPVALLKGEQLPATIQSGDLGLSFWRYKAVPSDPRNLVDANPQAFQGACNRVVVDQKMLLLVFLERRGADWVTSVEPFARSLEDVPSEDALWVKAVKIYIEIAALPKTQQRKATEQKRAFLKSEIDDPDSRLLALELTRALQNWRSPLIWRP